MRGSQCGLPAVEVTCTPPARRRWRWSAGSWPSGQPRNLHAKRGREEKGCGGRGSTCSALTRKKEVLSSMSIVTKACQHIVHKLVAKLGKNQEIWTFLHAKFIQVRLPSFV